MEHFNNPRNVGALDKGDPGVGTGVGGQPDCGDVMILQIRAGADGGIVDAKFKVFGCTAAIAAGSFATQWLKGRSVEQARKFRSRLLIDGLSLSPGKVHCGTLAEEAVRSAVSDWENGQRKPLGQGIGG